MSHQAKLPTAFGVLGIHCSEVALTGIEFLPATAAPQSPVHTLAESVCAQLEAWFADPDFRFDLPLALHGTAHQLKVWHALASIPRGQVLSYGELARRLNSAPRAIGQACGHNPLPIIIPCHRVVGRAGLGGFMQQGAGTTLEIKRWLLRHEGVAL
ncbi:MAG: methylated-DNA--[protein]-cysteine S-methyltransferase [Nitrosomonadales bacterium]|nr:methylated-DNA--[protein]-cysteine S-methyltransferase [Nitrosomonadales bacterium]